MKLQDIISRHAFYWSPLGQSLHGKGALLKQRLLWQRLMSGLMDSTLLFWPFLLQACEVQNRLWITSLWDAGFWACHWPEHANSRCTQLQ
jgi:hypothetical protein